MNEGNRRPASGSPGLPPETAASAATPAGSRPVDPTSDTVAELDPAAAETLPSDSGNQFGKPGSGSGRGSGAARQLGNELCGRVLHHFRVDAMIGRGGMGSVYRAHDLSLDRAVALKVIDLSMVEEPRLRERFVREARAQARLIHPHVVQIYYIGDQDDLCFFAMELVEGESLDDLLVREERLEWPRAVELMISIVEALELAQRQGIVHRDIKPSNLLVDSDGEVKVADFGLAKWVQDDAKITQEGRVVGTPLYMSPEQGQGEPTDFRSDIYSLGATFYHLIAGRPPFSAKTPMGIVVKHITQSLPPVRSTSIDVPRPVAEVIERMMAKEPDKRFADHTALLAALKAARPRTVTPAGIWVRAMAFAVDAVILLVAVALLEDFFWLFFPLYFVLGWWRFGQTVGKWLFRIQVRSRDHERLSLGRSFLRFFAMSFAPWVILALALMVRLVTGEWGDEANQSHPAFVGFIFGSVTVSLLAIVNFGLAIFRKDRRAVHDLIGGSNVIYKLEQ